MKIALPNQAAASLRRRRRSLLHMVKDAKRLLVRPCEGCTLVCICHGRQDCTECCTTDCLLVRQRLSIDGDRYPIEKGILPLVFEMASRQVYKPVWSCEGHEVLGGALKLPQVWFYSDPHHADLLAILAANSRSFSTQWTVAFMKASYPGLTWRLAPVDAGDGLSSLRQDATRLAGLVRTHLNKLIHDQIAALDRQQGAI